MGVLSVLSECDYLREENNRLTEIIKNATTRLELRRHLAHEHGNFEREDAMDEALTLITGKELWERIELREGKDGEHE